MSIIIILIIACHTLFRYFSFSVIFTNKRMNFGFSFNLSFHFTNQSMICFVKFCDQSIFDLVSCMFKHYLFTYTNSKNQYFDHNCMLLKH